ncbi:phosphoadenylyl-sulfate reductase [Parasphingopyxis sp. CP4]|uniref:phosphoadenylyl-sulfate reductase n=1 Tax=Parasphingopyxis sp. CP4 TaxID=2724527 RepID=UPI0015A23245|nr:phosphoadenylyl-sulfate reductase [Parasphingopyxis sp. CP4]QLC20920.1 phosphoadenylyl-sulfate reductase [Parasphingopyxis sp. CP4]
MDFATNQSLELRQTADQLNSAFAELSASQILDRVLNGGVAGRPAVISSFGAEAAALLKLIADKDPATPVVFLDTRKHFSDTLDYVDDLMDVLGLSTLVRVRPSARRLALEDPDGKLHSVDSDRCCYLRKTLPMIGVLRNYDCVLTGRKRYQTADRAGMDYVDVQESWLRVNPLADWSHDQTRDFLSSENLLEHPLVAMGYSSIGCEPCTIPSDDHRAGRWADEDKTECGIHITENGAVARIPKTSG